MEVYLAILNILLLGSEDGIKIIDNGTVSNFVSNEVSKSFPPIQPQFYEMKLRVKSKEMVREIFFSIDLRNSDGL